MDIPLGPIYAILTAFFFAAGQVIVRRSTHESGESFTAVIVSLLIGTPLFMIAVMISGEWDTVWALKGWQYGLLAAAGIIHFIIARYLFFSSTRLIGANITIAITRTSTIFAVVFGVLFLGETVTWQQVGGALLIMVGAVITGVDISRKALKVVSTRGLLLSLGTAIGATSSALLIRPVMEVNDAVYAATFVSYISAFAVIIGLLLVRVDQRKHLRHVSMRNLLIMTPAAIALVVGHVCRFSALKYSPVSIAQPLMATVVIFTLLLSWMLNRRIDVFHWRVILGIVMVLAGVFLVSGF